MLSKKIVSVAKLTKTLESYLGLRMSLVKVERKIDRDSVQAWSIEGGRSVEVYWFTKRLNLTGITRGSGRLNFHILMRNSDGRFSKVPNDAGEAMSAM